MSTWDKSKEVKLSLTRLKQVLTYEDGQLLWAVRQPPRGYKGKIAGSLAEKGYVWISIDGVKYPRCRLVWFYHHGVWPPNEVDHRNRVKHDDRIENLRLATRMSNSYNAIRKRKLPTGVYKHGAGYRVLIQANKQPLRVGCFKTIEEAAKAYQDASLRLHGEFSPFYKDL